VSHDRSAAELPVPKGPGVGDVGTSADGGDQRGGVAQRRRALAMGTTGIVMVVAVMTLAVLLAVYLCSEAGSGSATVMGCVNWAFRDRGGLAARPSVGLTFSSCALPTAGR
jgi:hypothetical protein